MDWQTMMFQFLGGLGLFLFGIKFMGEGLQKAAGDKLREVLDRFTTNPLMGVLVGFIVTVLIQSSSGTTVITVWLVSSGFLTLRQAVGVIMGANIGTTVTAFIIGFDVSSYPYLIMGLGAILLFFFKKSIIQNIGQILFGFAGLFIGLEIMSQVMSTLGNLHTFIELTVFFSEHPFLSVVIGIIFTSIIQSSSATIGILQELYAEGLITLNGALPILFGDNIGTTITAVLVSLGASLSARRAAASHLLFNVIGTVIFMTILPLFINYVEWITDLFNLEKKMQIAFAHGTFNLVNTMIQLPFIGAIVYIVTKMVPGEDRVLEFSPKHLDVSLIEQSPSIALNQVKQEVVRMGEFAVNGIQESMRFLFTSDTHYVDITAQLKDVIKNLELATTNYLIQLSKESLSHADSKLQYALLANIRDIVQVGDQFVKLVELIRIRETNGVKFSEEAMGELEVMYDLVLDTMSEAILSLDKNNTEFARVVISKENRIKELENVLRTRHIQRLDNGECLSSSAIIYTEMISNLQQIGLHAVNIANSILKDNRY
ncbi:phosphate:Na+ symporter [Ureibacillus xyleni]|uniref:Phosphate:Na+ symporter n=1 Tax=Ureibacillus xyleni TaxID=614648 RepID=A0A285SSW9_9BACL|nr:Na/Pi cotransporter family protein [Ureibacillus xyleni]SOC11597.1 phosphate:Na+ symporter [Ureibacillus xyleni]